MELSLGRPCAVAQVSGTGQDYNIHGSVRFYPFRRGVLVLADICGLPSGRCPCPDGIFALHIHRGDSCAGEDFSLTEGHYNPEQLPHPCHAGDLPPLFSNYGSAFMAVYTRRFSIRELIGRTVVIHSLPDDFTSQPAGAAGEKIACGVIRECRRRCSA